jgi:biuret amidohydrolase
MTYASDTALLLLDLQNEMTSPEGKVGAHGLATIVAERNVLGHAKTALDHARGKGHAIVHVRLGFRPDYLDCLSVAPRIENLKSQGAAIVGEFGTEFAPEVAPKDGELVITKQCVNPFFNTGLLTWLMQNGIKTIVLCGVATNLVVESSARYGDDAGFAVRVLADACAAPNPEWHAFSIEQILPVFSQVITTADYVAGA